MGIERFFSSINEQFDIITDIKYPYKKISTTHLFIDFNSIIHVVSSNIENTLDNINNVIINKVKTYIYDLLKNNFNSNKLKFIMIAIDGVPSKAKMIEQKRRRYLSELISLITGKNNIWNKNNISPGTLFMHLLSLELNKSDFLINLKKYSPNLKNLIVSDIYYFEEGEKKITNCINKMKFNKDDIITIYSPDSDVILLSMILKTENQNIIVYRHDQQKSKGPQYVFNMIDIKKLKIKITDYINLKNIKFQNQIDDIVLIFTIFGDDFLPKIESYDVKNDIIKILDFYKLTLIKTNSNLINNNKLNFDFFTEFLEIMSLIEDKVLKENNISKQYYNYNRNKLNNLNVYLIQSSELVKKNLHLINFDKFHKTLFSKLKTIFEDVMYTLLEFLDKKVIYNKINKKDKNFYFYFYFSDIDTIINDLIKYYFIQKTDQLPFINFIVNKKNKIVKDKLFEYSKSSNDRIHKNLIKNYDDEKKREYIINNKLDEYHYKFNANKPIFNKNIISNNKLVSEYLFGINWIFEYYFNDNMKNKLWFYPYNYTPSIKNIYSFLKKNQLPKFNYIEINDNTKYFTVLEQLLFITPLDFDSSLFKKLLNKDHLNKINEFIKSPKIKNMYLNLKQIAKEILNKKNNTEINCYQIYYLNKCELTQLNNTLDIENIFIKEFRKYISYQDQIKIFPMKGGEKYNKKILGSRLIKD